MPRHFKIDDLLSEPQRVECVALVLQRSTTVDLAAVWLRKRGHTVSRGAVHNWMRLIKANKAAPGVQLREALHELVSRMDVEELRHWTLEIARGSRAARFAPGEGEPAVNPASTPS